MKSTIIFLFLALAFGALTARSQETQTDLRVYDSVSAFTCEDLLSRLDGFASSFLQNKDAKGYVVIYGGDDAIRNKFVERYIFGYRKLRQLDENRFFVVTTKAAPDFKVEFLVSDSGKTKPSVTEAAFPFVLTNSEKPVMFVRETVEVVKKEGKWHYYGDCPACCIESYYSDFLSEYLKANPNLYARIKIYGRSKDHKEKLASLIREELITRYEVSSNRFLIRIEGIDRGIAQLPLNLATVEVDFVSQN